MIINNTLFTDEDLDLYLELKKHVREIKLLTIQHKIEPEHESLFIDALVSEYKPKN